MQGNVDAKASRDFEVRIGDDAILRVNVETPDGQPYDLTPATELKWQAARAVGGPAAITKSLTGGQISKDPEQPQRMIIPLPRSETADWTGRYFHECQVTDSQNHEVTVLTGHMTMRSALIN